jgi:3-oxo-4-pregnene-20-carboxyl-CoA dehydrogenase alpha subunit
LCRSAGYWAVPYPVAERLATPTDLEADGLIVVAENRPSGAVAGVGSCWVAVTPDGTRSMVTGQSASGAAFVAELSLSALDDAGAGDVALGLVLPCWTMLGMLDRALELTIAHVTLRKQFGQTLSSFQGVQFQLTEAEVERSGLDILAKYALWSIANCSPDALNDALALRMSTLEAAETVFRVCHQLHGAVGFCDETTLSWLSRYSQPLRRLPLGLSATRDLLTRRVGGRGLTGLYA